MKILQTITAQIWLRGEESHVEIAVGGITHGQIRVLEAVWRKDDKGPYLDAWFSYGPVKGANLTDIRRAVTDAESAMGISAEYMARMTTQNE